MKLQVKKLYVSSTSADELELASVDYETDKKIQETISREFHDRTILCIARMYLQPTDSTVHVNHLDLLRSPSYYPFM